MKYEKCLVELDEIIKYLPNEYLIRIPYNIRENIKNKKDTNYVWNYDTSKKLNEQNVNRKTIIILSYLNMKYILNEEQKEVMDKFHKYNDDKIERENFEKYNPNDIFKSNGTNIETNNIMLTVVEEKKWYQKVFDFFRKFFNKGEVK